MAWTTGRPINTDCLVSASRGVLGAYFRRGKFSRRGEGGFQSGKIPWRYVFYNTVDLDQF